MSRNILTLNAGSSSLKFALYADDGERLMRGQVKGLPDNGRLEITDTTGRGAGASGDRPITSLGAAVETVLDVLAHAGRLDSVGAVGHRVVHGGQHFSGPVQIDENARAAIEALSPLAPGHQPFALDAIHAAMARLPDAVHTASFDTAFHRTQAEVVRAYALPAELRALGIERYGFHGLSYDYLSHRIDDILPEAERRRVVAAHLGNGSSLCAMKDGRSAATSMGFTALEGLPMGTRCGSIDPGIALYLMRERNMSVEEVERAFYARSGLLGLSGETNDMAVLLGSERAEAAFAVSHYCHRAALGIAEMAAAIGGIDALVFAGGIGENAAPVRAAIVDQLSFLGLTIDTARNDAHHGTIDAGTGPRVLVIPTDEEWVLRRDAASLLSGG